MEIKNKPGHTVKKFKSFERDNSMFVVGKTMIDHAIRLRYNLSFRDYTVLTTIMELREGKSKSIGITYGQFWKASGIKPDHVQRAFAILKDKGLLYKDNPGLVQVSEEFKRAFTNKGDFEEFWKIDPKGAKAAAMRMYEKAIRIKPHNELCENYKKYLEFCKETSRFTKDTSTWLNPTSGFIDAEWVGSNEKKDDKQIAKIKSLDYDFIKK